MVNISAMTFHTKDSTLRAEQITMPTKWGRRLCLRRTTALHLLTSKKKKIKLHYVNHGKHILHVTSSDSNTFSSGKQIPFLYRPHPEDMCAIFATDVTVTNKFMEFPLAP